MWPLLVAVGAYMICKGIQDGIDTNRQQNQRQLPPFGGNDLSRYLPFDEDNSLNEEDWRNGRHGR